MPEMRLERLGRHTGSVFAVALNSMKRDNHRGKYV
jgi:hypothetical protein